MMKLYDVKSKPSPDFFGNTKKNVESTQKKLILKLKLG